MKRGSTVNTQESRTYIEFVIYRVPKNNHDSIVQIVKRSVEFFRKHDISYNSFNLIGSSRIHRFTNITKAIPVNSDQKEIWINMVPYKDRNHREELAERISDDKECQDIYETFMKLITPGIGLINGEFTDVTSYL